MRTGKRLFVILFPIIMLISICGCADRKNQDTKVENMKNYASEKYGMEFTVEYIQNAKDDTYTNILTLNDGEMVFNVYQSGDAEMSDDYPKIIANKKVCEFFGIQSNSTFDVFPYFLFTNGNKIAYEYAKQSDASTILEDYPLLKAIVIVRVDGQIADYKNELYDLYQKVLTWEPKYIDFQVIQAENMGSELQNMVKNIPALYDDNWSTHSEIRAYLAVQDTMIQSADELIKGAK